ncbi:kinase-like domain-containing protein [Suillus lakei]|nr:kinase-like domain-containing protein [Suillus lakei]
MENGSLDSYLKIGRHVCKADKLRMVRTLSRNTRRVLTFLQLRQIAASLEYLPDKRVVHGDLICTNILINSDGRFYLPDFGLSMILAESQNTTFNSCHPGNVW